MTNLVNYRIYGENHSQPIYILHGIFGMLDNWHLAAQKLSENYRVVTFDARNHGKSFHDVDASYSAMIQDLRAEGGAGGEGPGGAIDLGAVGRMFGRPGMGSLPPGFNKFGRK